MTSRFLDSDQLAVPLCQAELAGVKLALRYFNRDQIIPRLVATIDLLLDGGVLLELSGDEWPAGTQGAGLGRR